MKILARQNDLLFSKTILFPIAIQASKKNTWNWIKRKFALGNVANVMSPFGIKNPRQID